MLLTGTDSTWQLNAMIQIQARWGVHLKKPLRTSESHPPPEIKPKPLWSQYNCDLSVLKENYMSIGIYLSVGNLSFVGDI